MKMSEIIDMRTNGATYQEIADAVGLSKQWVRTIILKHSPELSGTRGSALRRANDQVNRLQAEVERLEEKLEEKSTEIKALVSSVDRLMKANKQEVIEYLKKIYFNAFPKEILNAIKFEALKEFERKIKVHAYYIDIPKEHRVVDEEDIAAVLRDMTEGNG